MFSPLSFSHTHTKEEEEKNRANVFLTMLRLIHDEQGSRTGHKFLVCQRCSVLREITEEKKQKVILVTCGSEVVSQSCGTVKLSAPAAHRALVSLTSYSTPQPFHQLSAQQRSCDVAATT